MLGRPIQFDFDRVSSEPDWLVAGLIERGTITVMSADSGVGKSMLAASIIVAGIRGRTWLGRCVNIQRALVIDEENFLRIVTGRLRGLGMTNDDRPNLRYFLRIGVQLGASDWGERVLDEMADWRPDLLVIDTAAAACDVELNDNSSVARLYASVLRPLADSCGVLLLHHERKPQEGAKRHAGHAMMGARQWAGQADAHIALRAVSDKPLVEDLPGGDQRRRYILHMEMPKSRDGLAVNEQVLIKSEHDAGQTIPRWIRVEKLREPRE